MTDTKRPTLLALAVMVATISIAQEGGQAGAEWQRMLELGHQHETARELYLALQKAAGGGLAPVPAEQLPDWSGLWTHNRDGVAAWRTGSFFGPGPGGTEEVFA